LWQRVGNEEIGLCGGTCGVTGVVRSMLELSCGGGINRFGLELSVGSRGRFTCPHRIYVGRGRELGTGMLESTGGGAIRQGTAGGEGEVELGGGRERIFVRRLAYRQERSD